MRIARLRRLCLLGNLGALVVVAFATLAFADAARNRAAAPDVAWPGEPPRVLERVPSVPFGRLMELIEVNVNGFLPEPDDGDDDPEKSEAEKFLESIEFRGGVLFSSARDLNLAAIEQGRVVQMIALGERLAGWQLVAFEPPGTEGSGVLRFRHHEHGRVDLELRPPQTTGLIGRLVVRTNDPSVLDGERRHVGAQAYPLDDEGRRWRMTAQELRWWRRFGRSMVWKPLGVEPHENTEGDVDGVTICTSPLAGTPLVGSRGVERGDVVHSVNGDIVRTKDELLVAIVLAWRTQNRVRLRVSRTGVARTVEFLFPNR